jgi:hypothetical protein
MQIYLTESPHPKLADALAEALAEALWLSYKMCNQEMAVILSVAQKHAQIHTLEEIGLFFVLRQ